MADSTLQPRFVSDPFQTAVRNLTLLAALLGYLSLAIYIVVLTWQAATGTAVAVPGVQAAALGALAVALGAGYAVLLGVPPKQLNQQLVTGQWWRDFWNWITAGGTGTILLGLGALAYLLVGIVIAVTYALNEAETPPVLRTIAIGFGGYVIAYLGAAYQKSE